MTKKKITSHRWILVDRKWGQISGGYFSQWIIVSAKIVF